MAMGSERARATVRHLQADITSGRWPLDSRIPTEHELAAELGVGRSTVREAVRSLAHLGMLEPAPGRGTFVRSLSPLNTVLADFAASHSPADLLQLRQALEVQAARTAAQQASDDQVERLRQAHARDVEAQETDPVIERGRTPGSFHSTLIEITGNDLLAQLYGTVMTAIRAAQASGAIGSQQSALERRGEHALLVQAIALGNPEAAAAAALAHAGNDLHLVARDA